MVDILRGVGQGLEAIAAGQQYRQREQEFPRRMALQDLAIKEAKIGVEGLQQKQANTKLADQLSQTATSAWKNQDRQGMRTAIGQLARIDNKRAVALANTWGGLDKSNFVEAAYNLHASAMAEDLEAKNTLIQRAKDAIGDPNNPLMASLDEIQKEELGEKRDSLEFQGIEFAKMMGAFPEQRIGPGGKTKQQIERELAVKERQAQTAAEAMALRRKEYSLKEDTEKWERSRLTPSGEKILEKVDDRVFENERTVGLYETLAQDFDRLAEEEVEGGVTRSLKEIFKELLGSQDETTFLYRKFRGIRASEAVKNLPPGPASDVDIKKAEAGLPPPNAKPEYVASWLRGVAKMAKLDSIYHKERSNYLSREKTQAGFNEYWNKNRYKLMGKALGMSEADVRGGREALESRAREDIKKEMSEAQAKNIPTFGSIEEARAADMTGIKEFRIGDEIYQVER